MYEPMITTMNTVYEDEDAQQVRLYSRAYLLYRELMVGTDYDLLLEFYTHFTILGLDKRVLLRERRELSDKYFDVEEIGPFDSIADLRQVLDLLHMHKISFHEDHIMHPTEQQRLQRVHAFYSAVVTKNSVQYPHVINEWLLAVETEHASQ